MKGVVLGNYVGEGGGRKACRHSAGRGQDGSGGSGLAPAQEQNRRTLVAEGRRGLNICSTGEKGGEEQERRGTGRKVLAGRWRNRGGMAEDPVGGCCRGETAAGKIEQHYNKASAGKEGRWHKCLS